MTKAKFDLGPAKQRIPDDLWLTPRCQKVVNDFNAGTITEEAALVELEAVGNTRAQAQAVIDLHRGRPQVKVKRPKKKNPLRPARM